ncbi:MAG: hypothetical protein ACREQJ_15285, partial [Candidatus Binatia bacterium]
GAPERPAPREPQRVATAPEPEEASAEPAPPAREAAAAGDAEGWESFIRFVQERRLTLYLNLMQARPLHCRAGTVVLTVPRDTPFQRELARRENLDMLASLAAEHFGTPTAVRVEAADAAAAEEKSEDPADDVRSDPAVQQAVNILGGAVREVRDARRR